MNFVDFFLSRKTEMWWKKKKKISYTLPLIAFLNFNTFHIWKGKEMDFWIVKDDKREMHYVSTLKCLIMVSPTLQPLFSLFCKTPTVILIQPLSLPPPIINLRCWYMKIQLFIFVFLTSQYEKVRKNMRWIWHFPVFANKHAILRCRQRRYERELTRTVPSVGILWKTLHKRASVKYIK